jgi:predicted negative regulator of RcsB-dependent stress response
MKTERRHELEQNMLADWLATRAEFIRHYLQAIVASLVAVVVIVGAWAYISRRSANQEAAAWQQVFVASDTGDVDGLARLADHFGSTTAGQWARMRLADIKLDQGINQSFDDRAASQKALAEAVDNYRTVQAKTGDAERKQRATLGLARAYESQDKLPDAREQYDQLVKQWPDTVYGQEARARLVDLDKQSTKQFYDWFAQRDAKPAEGPAIPGLKPKFDSSSLPSESDFKFDHGPALTPSTDDKGATSQAKKPAGDPSSDQK